jgi:hypothetical protein
MDEMDESIVNAGPGTRYEVQRIRPVTVLNTKGRLRLRVRFIPDGKKCLDPFPYQLPGTSPS